MYDNTHVLDAIQKRGFDTDVIKYIANLDKSIKKISKGYCPCCEQETIFISEEDWLRDYYGCVLCGSIPRQRAIMKVLNDLRPNYCKMVIHESSPSGCLMEKFKKRCSNYTYSYYDENNNLLEMFKENDCSNQNLESMDFEDDTFDIFITQDVFEHVLNPLKAFAEIGRVLKCDGIHIFTVPLYPFLESRPRVKIIKNNIHNILPPQYHGNPISADGALVTYDWGHDLPSYVEWASGMKTDIYQFMHTEENHKLGLEADFLYVCVSHFD